MSTVINNPAMSAPAGTATTKFKLVTINSDGEADLCGATDTPVGQSMNDVDAGAIQGIRFGSAGTQRLTANQAIDRLSPVYTAALGKVTDVPVEGCKLVGIALDAATTDGDQIEVLPAAEFAGVVQALAALTYAAPAGGATQDAEARASLAQLAADVTALRTSLIDSKRFVSA